ncbi:MAG: hypothetical protein U5K54_22390 [Cytophagales bacterium]|nr:hypothetical protein [Cytophagales bacterium]
MQRKNQEAPEGWIQKKDGSISTNPNELKDGGVPFAPWAVIANMEAIRDFAWVHGWIFSRPC